jgi:DNA-binding MarR family transcriptional regulator
VFPERSTTSRRFGYTGSRTPYVGSLCWLNREVTVVAASDAAAGLPLALVALNAVLLGRLAQDASELLGAALEPLGLRLRHFAILTALAESGASSQHALGERLHIDRTTMVGAVDDLERLGLATRAPDPNDRRAYLVALTSRGRITLVRATGLIATAESTLLAPLSPSERTQLHGLLARLVRKSPAEVRPARRRPATPDSHSADR